MVPDFTVTPNDAAKQLSLLPNPDTLPKDGVVYYRLFADLAAFVNA